MLTSLFKLRQQLDRKTSIVLSITGILLLLGIWILLTTPFLVNKDYLTAEQLQAMVAAGEIETVDAISNPKTLAIVPRSSLPAPLLVFTSYGDLYLDNQLIQNACKSIGLNLGGYLKAIMWSLPIGFLIGLVPLFRGAFKRVVDSIRFIPLTAVTVLFIVWFGIGTGMKVNFLAFGIMIYLLPVIVQRIDEVNDTYLKTAYTLGANAWQTVRTVYLPSVLSRLSDDIRILTAISWTYIIVAENSGDQGGLGSLIYKAGQRQGRVDKVFAILILIILIGVFQDKIFAYIDRKFFPHKYQSSKKYQPEKLLKEVSLVDTVVDFAITIFVWICLGLYVLFAANEFIDFLGGIKPLSYLFADTQWAIHIIFLTIIGYKTRGLLQAKAA